MRDAGTANSCASAAASRSMSALAPAVNATAFLLTTQINSDQAVFRVAAIENDRGAGTQALGVEGCGRAGARQPHHREIQNLRVGRDAGVGRDRDEPRWYVLECGRHLPLAERRTANDDPVVLAGVNFAIAPDLPQRAHCGGAPASAVADEGGGGGLADAVVGGGKVCGMAVGGGAWFQKLPISRGSD